MKSSTFFQRRYFLPSEHGSWIWWIGPTVIGISAAGRWSADLAVLFLAMLSAFLLRQPLTLLVKTISGRRSTSERLPALLWVFVYGAIAAAAFLQLLAAGFGRLSWLLLPAIGVFLWQMILVSHREERGQRGIEIVGSGVLALAAPASYWVAGGSDTPLAWFLWMIAWLQSAASIVLVYQRLHERRLERPVAIAQRHARVRRSLAYHGFNLAFILAGGLLFRLPWLVTAASSLMLIDAVDSLRVPAVGWKPSRIGLRQLLASSLFMILVGIGFILQA